MTQVKNQRITVKSARKTGHKISGSIAGTIWNFIIIWIHFFGHLISNAIDSLHWLAGFSFMAISIGYSLDSYCHLTGHGAFFPNLYFWGVKDLHGIALSIAFTSIVCHLQWEGAKARMKSEALGDDVSNLQVDKGAIIRGRIAYAVEAVVALISLLFVDNGLNGVYWLLKPVFAYIMVFGVETGYRIWHDSKD